MRTLPAPPCPRCGSTDTYADAIEAPTSYDDPAGPVPVIPGIIHCCRCESLGTRTVMRIVAGPGDTGYVIFGTDDPMQPALHVKWDDYLAMGSPSRIVVTVEPSSP